MYLIIDCGTTNLRVTLVEREGSVIAQGKRPGGVRHTAIDGNNDRLKAMLSECIEEVFNKAHVKPEEVERCVAYGMITSNMGLVEIPHLAAPVSAEDLHSGMRTETFPEIAPFPISFIPGVRNFSGKVTMDNFSNMDMMRGEEVETIGLFELLKPEEECVFVLPGSHNKFVRVDREGHILGCMTSISGEILDAMTHHTILADAVGREFASEEDYNAEMVCKGALECASSGLGRAAFAGRILNQLGDVECVRLRSYLLGATLAQDVMALRSFVPEVEKARIYIAGKKPLQAAVADVMNAMGIPHVAQVASEFSERMGIQGVLRIL